MIRILDEQDLPALTGFFARHPDTTLFLQGNLRDAGIVDEGRRHQGTWVGAIRDGEITAVAAHFWNGNLVLECPHDLDEVVRLAAARSGRALAGILGPRAQVLAAREALGASAWPLALDSDEDLFALPLGRLRIPPALAAGSVRCRATREDDLPLLTQWRVDYSLEILGARDSPELRAGSAEDIAQLQRTGRQWLLEADGQPVSYSAFNAMTSDCVQVGGVFTPPTLRGRGYARCVVAGTLRLARERGLHRAILFTGRENAAAQRAYRALGFERVGDFGILFFGSSESV